ncbi:MAG: transcription termination/antitermination protein NusA [Bacteroidaceae bacterium]|nr:transcription termination/antitermination protein NusA [Bacteroidaceae bacterium]MBR7028485.1 transcription termination/antitermination protein NusA [Bacteroidaceae bacterium]
MAKKKVEAPRLIETFSEFKDNKNIDRTTLVGVLEESFRNVITREYGTDENFDVIVNPDKGDFEIYRTREVVEDGEVTDSNKQIALSEARKIEDDYEVGEDVSEKIDITSFGRRSILTLRQTLASKILELEHENLYQKYKEREGEMVSAEVYQTWKNETLLMDDEGNELILPKSQQIPRDFFHKGDTVRAIIDHVDNPNGHPKIYLSRTCEAFLLKLLEQEIPEIADNLITVRRIARMPGERAKIAVESYDDRIDPVGACVGVKGSRIHTIVREMHNENIDVIHYSANLKILIQRALQPAQISSIELDDEAKSAAVYLRPQEVSLAIGKNGINIKLASKLTGYTIDVFRQVEGEDEEEDIYLEEFADEIDQWVIDAITSLGFKTARDVLKAPRQVLIEQADLEESTVDDVYRILKAEFDEV